MDEGAQEDEQFDNEKSVGSENSSASENSEADDDCWKCWSYPNRVKWVSGTLVQGQQAKDEVRKMRNRQGIQKSSLVEEESDMKRNEFEWSISSVRKAGKRNESQWRTGCPTRRWRSNIASGTDRRGVSLVWNANQCEQNVFIGNR